MTEEPEKSVPRAGVERADAPDGNGDASDEDVVYIGVGKRPLSPRRSSLSSPIKKKQKFRGGLVGWCTKEVVINGVKHKITDAEVPDRPKKKLCVHRCSFCRAGFSSAAGLSGHMRLSKNCAGMAARKAQKRLSPFEIAATAAKKMKMPPQYDALKSIQFSVLKNIKTDVEDKKRAAKEEKAEEERAAVPKVCPLFCFLFSVFCFLFCFLFSLLSFLSLFCSERKSELLVKPLSSSVINSISSEKKSAACAC